MSEYQYYEFLAIDRPLTATEIKELRKLSTRAEITATRFSNVYHWGNFGGSPRDMMEKYFDAHVYVTNWGTYELMLRFPRGLIDEELLREYCIDDPFSFWVTKEHLIIGWYLYSEEGGEWVSEGEDWMSQLIQVRSEIEKGDYRSLYIGFLLAISIGLPDEDTMEPPVPPGLASLTASQQSLIEFLEIDEDLVSAAAIASEPLAPRTDQTEDMRACIDQLQDDEMKQMLLRVLSGESRSVESELRRRYNQFLQQSRPVDAEDGEHQRRVVPELFALVEEARQQRLEREARVLERERAAEERRRRKYLAGLGERFPENWGKIEELAKRQTGSAYGEAVELLVDLSDAYEQLGRAKEFNTQFSRFLSRHQRRTALMRRMKEAGLKQTIRVL
ncbi:hypothetical protein ACFL6S_34475 [Candidatus Poribacteria bacterium]